MQLLEPKRVILFRDLDRNTMVFLPPGSLVLFSIPVVVAKLEIIQCTFTKKRQSNLTLVSFPPLSLLRGRLLPIDLIVGRRGQFLQPGAQLLLQELLGGVLVASGGGRRRCGLHQLVVTAEAGATAQGRRLQLDHLGRRGELGADALPAGLTASVTHGEIALPQLSAETVADHAGPLQAVATALGTVQGDLLVGPHHSAGETGAQLGPQVLDGEHRLGTHLEGGGRQGR